MQNLRSVLVGDRAFYKAVLSIVTPIIVQNAITNFVSLLDNVMVGQVGTVQMSGVAIANTLLFVYTLCIFGAISGAGIFGAQFAGAGDHEGVRASFRYKILVSALLLMLALVVFIWLGEPLIRLYLTDPSDPQATQATLQHGLAYLRIMLWGLLPLTLSTCYAGTLRETGETILPMVASIAAVLTNLCGNYVLIFGHFGFPALGVEGAAIATVISRYVELAVILLTVHRHPDRFPAFCGAWRTMKIPRRLFVDITLKGMPLLVNECFWSTGQAFLAQLYSVRGLLVVAGFNISNTVVNLFSTVYLSMGNAAAILVGQALGADEPARAKKTAWQIIALNVEACVALGVITVLVAPLIPRFYNTTDEVRALASTFIRTNACFMPVFAFAHCTYFVLRSGGKTLVTFLFDSAFSWVVCVPVAAALIYLTALPMQTIYALVLSLDIIKCLLGYAFVKKGVWIHNIVK